VTRIATLLIIALLMTSPFAIADEELDRKVVDDYQQDILDVVEKVTPAFVFIGAGSSCCIDPEGWILTNHHVAGNTGKEYMVQFTGGDEYKAKVIGHDPRGDIALLKIENPPKEGLPYLKLADSDACYEGQRVIAMGNPFLLGNENYEPTITYGIISALHRFQEGYNDAIQTDAQINPGNSGGPLINLKGEVIGVNGRIALKWGNRVNGGVGYAIPANQVKNFLGAFKAGGLVRHAYADGIVVSETRPAGNGVLVNSVKKGSPGEKAGLKPGDEIFEIDGHEVKILNRFHGIVGTHPAGASVPIKYRRGDEVFESTFFMGKKELFVASSRFEKKGTPYLGIRLAKPIPGADLDGLEVEEVTVGGPCDMAGMQPGDVIRKIGEKEVGEDYNTFEDLILEHKPADTIKITIHRFGADMELEVDLGEK
jgi:S1-C subfamily serine protease